MAKMKILQPEMLRLKELHKDDKVKLQQEMMTLYKSEKVNPLSGCLPILIQIPFFFAIYKMLFISLEMIHHPFF
jgi:YidC/Oxa1 family membrane protein insertase